MIIVKKYVQVGCGNRGILAYPYAIYTKDGERSVSYGECINIDFNHKEEFLTNQYNKTNNILLYEIK